MPSRLRLLEERIHKISSLLEKEEVLDEKVREELKRELEILKIEVQTLRNQFHQENFRDK